MRVIVFFDLPVKTASERKAYTNFRKFLLNSGFMMMQKSVYCKLTLNSTSSNIVSEMIKRNKPDKGLIQVLIITEKQYSKIEFIIGGLDSEVINTNERTIIL